MTKEDEKKFNKIKSIVGWALFFIMFIVFVFVKEFDIILFIFPAILFGIKPENFFKK